MLARTFFAVMLGLSAVLASTRSTYAATLSDREDVMIFTGVVVLIAMFLLYLIYLVRHSFGLDKVPPPEPDAGNAHH